MAERASVKQCVTNQARTPIMSKIAFLFPGQGAQSVGMGRALAESVPAAKGLYQRASDILGYDLASLCFEGPADRLNSTAWSQPALFVTSLAAFEALRAEHAEVVAACGAAAGLSLGEYTALVVAGALDFEAGLRLVQVRGRAMQEAADRAPGGMLSVMGLDQTAVHQLCVTAREGETLDIANLLCPGNIVVSGSATACARLVPLAEAAGAMKVMPLAVAGAFHTELMRSAVEPLRKALEAAPLRRPEIPVISNVDASPHDDPDQIRALLARQVVSPVRWEDSIRFLLRAEFEPFYEIGPGRVLRGLLRRIRRKAACENVAA